MRLTIKAKQVVGVTSIVGLAVIGLSSLYLSWLVRVRLEESQARGQLLANAVYQRAQAIVTRGDPYEALRADEGLKSILESSAYGANVTYAAIVDVGGVVVAHSDAMRVGEILPPYGDLAALLDRGLIGQLRAIYSDEGQTLEVGQRLLLGSSAFGSIRLGVSTLLIRDDITKALRPALVAVAVALVGSSVVAMLLAQLLLRPIHVLRRSLTRLGERDFDVADALPRDEFGELGESLAVASARLLADRAGSGERRQPEPLTSWLEDSIAVFDAEGALVFASSGMRATLPPDALGQSVSHLFTPEHPYRTLVEEGLARGQSNGPLTVLLPPARPGSDTSPAAPAGEQVVRSDVLRSRNGKLAGVLIVARDADRLRQVQFTLNHSRRMAALGRLSAGLAHEIKNPLNATMIRLELLRQQLSPAGTESVAPIRRADGTSIAGSEPGEASDLGEHVEVIAAQIRRLDEVVQGFLKFIRPEDIRLQPVALADILAGIMPIIEAEAQSHGVVVRTDVPAGLPDLAADQAMLEQALLNLAINACQAMREGGVLRIAAAPTWGRYVAVQVEDNGIGIPPADLDRIFDLYFTTKEGGSGIGLSMVFRAVHLHGGEITVESTPGRGTTFRLLLPQA
ncbi:MAG: ATP-binding protein [Vicinamibacterales bacterium]